MKSAFGKILAPPSANTRGRGHWTNRAEADRPACFVTSEAPRAATELSFGVSCLKFRVDSDFGIPEARFALFVVVF